jgi:MSHA biogenesis protein MshK
MLLTMLLIWRTNISRAAPLVIAMLLCIGTSAIAAAAGVPASSLFDPTQPYNANRPLPSGITTATPSLRLEAILLSTQRRVAIINGQLVREGSRVGTAVIDTITATEVRYSDHGQQHVMQLATASLTDKQLRITRSHLQQDAQP